MKIKYKESTLGGMMAEPVLVASYKSVRMVLATKDDWVSIYSVDSFNPGKGEVQEMIDLVKKDFPDKRLLGSVPLNQKMKHIYIKKRIPWFDEKEGGWAKPWLSKS